MIDFGDVVYADMQKTGSTYVIAFLKKYLSLPLLRRTPHGPLDDEIKKSAFCFISVRNPVSQYVSLYRYGCDSRGGLFKHLEKQGKAVELYTGGSEGFHKWLDFVLNPENAELCDVRYSRASPDMIGLMTFRYLFLAMPKPLRLLNGIEDRDALRQIVKRNTLVSTHVRNENLAEDLSALCQTDLKPYLRNQAKALSWLSKGNRLNVSKTPGFGSSDISKEALGRIQEREWFLYETLQY